MPLPIIAPIIEWEALEGSFSTQVSRFQKRLPVKAAATKAQQRLCGQMCIRDRFCTLTPDAPDTAKNLCVADLL